VCIGLLLPAGAWGSRTVPSVGSAPSVALGNSAEPERPTARRSGPSYD
jgi:hypothetical protein